MQCHLLSSRTLTNKPVHPQTTGYFYIHCVQIESLEKHSITIVGSMSLIHYTLNPGIPMQCLHIKHFLKHMFKKCLA